MIDSTLLKANTLGGMNSYIVDVIGDEVMLDIWFRDGIPDGCSEEMLMEIAEDTDEFARISYLFGNLVSGFY